MENLLVLAPLLVCPLMMLLVGGGIAHAMQRFRRPVPDARRSLTHRVGQGQRPQR